MKKIEKHKYLGDIICSSGSNSENINERSKIGFQAISQIKSFMKDVQLGSYSIQVELILRESLFISKILLNSEVWHSVTKVQIEKLEMIDKILLRHALNAHSKTGVEWLYADTGSLSLKSLMQVRRLMYLWHILSRDEEELIHRIYKSQSNSSSVGDWVRLVSGDKDELSIEMTDAEIQGVSKNVFKNFVMKKVKRNHIEFLNTLKRKHSKSSNLDCKEVKMAEYLQDSRFSTKMKQLLFKLRSRTLDVKQNFKNINQYPWCRSCGLFAESQGHILQCPELTKHLSYLVASKLDENDIYSDVEKQLIITKIYSDLLEIREKVTRNELK